MPPPPAAGAGAAAGVEATGESAPKRARLEPPPPPAPVTGPVALKVSHRRALDKKLFNTHIPLLVPRVPVPTKKRRALDSVPQESPPHARRFVAVRSVGFE